MLLASLAALTLTPQLTRLAAKPESALAAGSTLLLALVANRLATDELLNSQSRADLIATVAPIVIALDGLTKLDITPKEADLVPIGGTQLAYSSPALSAAAASELSWAADALVDGLACSSLAIFYRGKTLFLRGVFSSSAASADPHLAVQPGPLLSRCVGSKSRAPEYLPALQLLPGRIEFGYLPELTQGVLMLPLGENEGAVIVGADRVRQFKSDDVAWARALARRIGEVLRESQGASVS